MLGALHVGHVASESAVCMRLSTSTAADARCAGLQHACLKCNRRLEIEWVEAAELVEEGKKEQPEAYKQAWARLCHADAILVPGGFGSRGVEGMVLAARHARSQVSTT